MPLAAKQMKVKCIPGWSGACLEKARGRFDLIYLDYCGTVDGNANFCPANYIEKAEKMLRPGGVLAATFSKRNAKYLLAKCLSMTPLPLRRCFEYCETSDSGLVGAPPSSHRPPSGVRREDPRRGRVLEVYVDGVSLEPVGKKETSAMLTLAWSERPLPPIGPPLLQRMKKYCPQPG